MIRRAWQLFRQSDTVWQWVAEVVTRRPWHVMGLALVALLPPLLALPAMTLSHDELQQLPADAESRRGFEAIGEHIPEGELAPTLLIIEDDDTQIWDPEAMEALGQLSRNLKRMSVVASVRSVAMPTNGRVPDLASMGGDAEQAEQITDMTEGLEQAANGAARLEDGVERLRDGLQRIATRLPELVSGLEQGRDGAERLRAGIAEAVDGVSELRDGLAQLRDGLGQLRSGMVEARDGTRQLRDDVAHPTEDSLERAIADLRAMTVGRTDPMYEQTYRDVGEAYARVTGEYPPGHEREGEQIRDDYEGLPEALGQLADGLDEMIGGVDRLDEGMGEFDAGLARLADGLREAEDGAGRLADGLGEAVDGVERLQAGIQEMLTGVDDRLLPGVGRLADGLQAGVAQLESSGFADILGGGEGTDQEFVIPAALPDTLPRVKEQLAFFVADEGTRTRIFIGTEAEPFAPEAINAVPEMVRIAELSLNDSPLEDATILPTGTSAFFENVEDVSNRDFKIIVVAVVLGVYLVMALLLRALVAPLYMMATVLLSWATSLGITVIYFEGVLDQPIAWFVPSFLFVLLVALGADYNIFLMSRVREEASHRSTTDAVATGVRLTGGVITSAGLILAGTFAAMVFTNVASLEQTGFAVAVGVLLDTFIVRSFLVPSIAVVLGRHNWWPSKRARPQNEPTPA